MKISEIHAREILDSRGNPTVETTVMLENGVMGRASVPSGASTGAHEALEKRDGEERYFGKGVLFAVEEVNRPIREAIRGMDARNQRSIDRMLQTLDGTDNFEILGANSVLSVSLACARAAAESQRMPLYRYLGGAFCGGCPRTMMNILNGGAHADNNVDIQEFMIVPAKGVSARESVRMGAEIGHALRKCLRERGHSTLVGDEGGFAPNLESDEEALELLAKASLLAGYTPGEEVFFALDFAASEWQDGDGYRLPKRGTRLSREEMLRWCESLVRDYPILSVEDPLAEDDFDGFARLQQRIGEKCLIVGDDLFATHPERIRKGIEGNLAGAALIKPNQIGTLSQTVEAIAQARSAGWKIVVSHRSGETTDDFLSDFAVAARADFIKAGAPCRGERVQKYNRLMEIEEQIFAGAGQRILESVRFS